MSRRLIGRIVALTFLAVVGGSNAVGSTLELAFPRVGKAVASVGRVTLASPAPKVFCKMGGIEPFAREHAIDLRYDDGKVEHFAMGDSRAIRLRGPYALRNVYGAAIVFAPLLPKRTTESIVRRGICDGAAFDTPLGGGGRGPVQSVIITSAPQVGLAGEIGEAGESTRVEVACLR